MAYITNTKISLEDIVDANIPNTDALPIDLKELKGNTTQNGTPTPTNPVSVVNVTGEQKVVICGKNLYDKSTTYSTGGSNQNIANDIILKPSTNYYFYTGKTWTTLYLYDENNQQTRQLGGWQSASYISFTTASNEVKGKFTFYAQNNVDVTTYDFTGIQLEQNNQATSYEPYQGKTYNINLGKNLLNVSSSNVYINNVNNPDITTTYDESKNRVDFQVNSLPSQYSQAGYYYAFKTIIGKTYKVKSIWGNTSSTPVANVRICSDTSGTTAVNNMTSNTEYSFTATQETYYFRVWITTTIGTGYLEYAIVSASDTTFSPYKTPIELCKIGTYQDFIKKSTGKNLFDKDNANVLDNMYTDGSTNTIKTSNGMKCIYIQCKANTTYTISKIQSARFNVAYTTELPASGVSIRGRIVNNSATSLTITTDGTTNYLVAFIYHTSDTLTFQQIINSLMIEEGNIQTPVYEPYGKVWYIKKTIGKVVLDGSEDENWVMGNNSFGKRFTYRYLDNSVISDTTNGKKSLCNYFPLTVNAGTWNNKNCYVITSNKEFICTLDETYTTLEQFKTWLSTHNTSVYYVSANPTYEVITDDELISQLEKFSKARTYRTQTNINQISNNLPFFIDLDVYSTENLFENVIYSQENDNKCKIYFNDVELQDADEYLEKITFTKRVLPENGKKVFGLDNFIAEEVEIIIHDIDTSIIQDKVRIELGTLVNNTYEYVPMGIYNIQDTPTRNDDKITIKLRDNAVLFDFNYNGYPLIEQQGGSATKMQILQDICSQANVNCNVESFLGDSDLIGTYDNTVKGRMYVAYLAEQAGCIAKIDRNGNLIFIPLNNLITHRIPLSIVSKYVKGTPYKIERIVYELGTIKFETSNDETLQTLYISSSNPYISTQEQIESIFNEIGGFEINSTEILSNIIGNPSIDGYDLIEVYDDENINETILFKTFANNTFIYNGKFKSKYKTEIGLEERKENTTNNGDEVFKKTIKSEVDRLDGKITTEIAETKTYTDDKTNTLRTDLQGQISNVDTDLQEYKQTISTTFQQTTESFDFRFTNITDLVGQVSNTENEHYEELIKYIRFVNGVIILGEEGNELTAELSNNRLSFKQNGNEVAYISNQKLYITDTEVLQNIIIGNFAFIPRSNGSLSFRKVR